MIGKVDLNERNYISGPIKFIKALIVVGMLLGILGKLPAVSLVLGKKAIKANQKGGIKFKELNGSLKKVPDNNINSIGSMWSSCRMKGP